jgi:hypothetical protein
MRAVWCITANLAADDRDGSLSTKSMWPRHVGYYPKSDRVADAQMSADPELNPSFRR